MLLLGKQVLGTRSDFRFRIVGPPHPLGHSAAFRLLAMDVADEAILVQERLVGRRSVGGIGHTPLAVMLLSSKPFGFRTLRETCNSSKRERYEIGSPVAVLFASDTLTPVHAA